MLPGPSPPPENEPAAGSWPEKSAPAQNDRPSAASTMARQSGSASRASNAVAISPMSPASKTLYGGRRSSTTPTRPSCSTSTPATRHPLSAADTGTSPSASPDAHRRQPCPRGQCDNEQDLSHDHMAVAPPPPHPPLPLPA